MLPASKFRVDSGPVTNLSDNCLMPEAPYFPDVSGKPSRGLLKPHPQVADTTRFQSRLITTASSFKMLALQHPRWRNAQRQLIYSDNQVSHDLSNLTFS